MANDSITTTKPTPPAGTKTHKAGCACIQCKAKRYDVLLTEYTALKAEVEKLERWRAEEGAENRERVIAYIQERAKSNVKIAELREALQQEQNASRGGMLITLCAGMFLTALVAFLIGRFGR